MAAIHPDNSCQGRWPVRLAKGGHSSEWQHDGPPFAGTLHCYISCSGNDQDKSNPAFQNQPIGFLLITLLLWIPSGSTLIDYNLCIFYLSVYQKIRFFFQRNTNSSNNRDLLAKRFLCEDLTPASSQYFICTLVAFCCLGILLYTTLCVKLRIYMNISKFYLNSPDVYSLWFQVQERSVTNAEGIMETSQPISSRKKTPPSSFFPPSLSACCASVSIALCVICNCKDPKSFLIFLRIFWKYQHITWNRKLLLSQSW